MYFSQRIRSLLDKAAAESRATQSESGDIEISTVVLSPRQQLRMVGLISGGVLAIAVVGAGVRGLASYVVHRDQAPAAAIAPGSFKPTATQMDGLKIEAVATMEFRSEQTTEGNIAIDDNVATPVFSPYSGRVTRLMANVGDVVAKGAPLLVVEASEFVQAQGDLVTATSTVDATKAQLTLATQAEKRTHSLYDVQGAALKDWQQTQADLAAAQTAARTAEAALAAARNRLRILGKSDAQIDALARNPDVGGARPEAVIAAPISGTVLQRQVGVGQYIQANASAPVYAIGDLSKVWLVANVRESEAAKVRPGQLAEVHVLAIPGRTFSARLTTVGPMIDPVTHRLPVRAEIENPDGVLKPQMFATFSIITSAPESAPAVPESAIVTEGGTARVWVAGADNTLSLRQIRTGRSRGDMVEVIDGLSAGEKIATAGALFIDRASNGS